MHLWNFKRHWGGRTVGADSRLKQTFFIPPHFPEVATQRSVYKEKRDKNAERMRKAAFRALTSGSNGSCEQCALTSLQDFLKVIDTLKTFQDDQVMV